MTTGKKGWYSENTEAEEDFLSRTPFAQELRLTINKWNIRKKSKKLLGSKGNTVSCCGNTPSGTKSWPVVCQEKD